MKWTIVNAEAVAPQPWRNGGGITRELLAWPQSPDWTLRISVADVEADGPFSRFEGIQRWFAILQGEGVRLFERDVHAGDTLLAFDGALAPDCTLLAGKVRDFNLMHRRQQGRMAVVEAGQPVQASADWFGLFTAEGGCLHAGTNQLHLPAMSLAWTVSAEAINCHFEGSGSAWWMSWWGQ
ncbi:HutD/Ves family protein [Parachitinimonas caeni]|uniref:HutD family protein n=1 Tax=Parachitinimonas caeni TaxID=3031301 RepID=A0ABT7DVL0_9NEIS|nr:HutD family protein [Parachitinimonas caeni]MDK2123190.1 HutD family protein [Parachitinimonas caeni]